MAFNILDKKKKNQEEKPKKKRGVIEEWVRAAIFAVIVASIIRWLFFSAYTIPTPSMEGTQLVGDYLFVNKMSYGARTPKTLLHMPLTDNKIWGTNIPSYLTWIQLPQLRLPGYSSVQRNDIVVFNFPPEEAPTDVKTHYIKRCVAVGGDKIEIKNTQIYINDKKVKNPPNLQYSYLAESKGLINERVFDRLEISEFHQGANNRYLIFATEAQAKALEKLSFIKKVERQVKKKSEGESEIFPKHPDYEWNEDHFGPLLIPAEGMKININRENLILYGEAIKRHEGYSPDEVVIDVENASLKIEGKSFKEYTFSQNYYFMMGDNRHNSLDSRFWGFVPQSHVAGEAAITWFSISNNPRQSFFERIRWERVFTWIN